MELSNPVQRTPTKEPSVHCPLLEEKRVTPRAGMQQAEQPAPNSPRVASKINKKDLLLNYGILLLYSLASIGLAALFLRLCHTSMNTAENQFDDSGSWADNHVRAIAVGIIVLAMKVLGYSVSTAVNAYRTSRLTSRDGILELDYVAIGGLSFMYQWRALRSKALQIIVLIVGIMVLTNVRSLFQPLLTFATQSVVVNENTGATAQVYSGGHLYAREWAPLGVDLNLGLEIMTTTGQYSSAGSSIFKDSANGREVTTGVVRVGVTRGIQLNDSAHAGLMLRLNDTFGQVQSSCRKPDKERPVIFDGPPDGPGTGNSKDENSGWRYSIWAAAARDGTKVSLRLTLFRCRNCKLSALNDVEAVAQDTYQVDSALHATVHHENDVECSSVVTLKSGCFKFALGTQNLTLLKKLSKYNSTTVSPEKFPDFVMTSSKSYDLLVKRAATKNGTVTDSLKNFPKGLFVSSEANFLHARVCGSVALALKYLHIYGTDPRIENIDPSQDLEPQSLYRPSIRAYIHEGVAWAIALTFAGLTVGSCMIGAYYTSKALVDVKGNQENALLYGVSPQCNGSECTSECKSSCSSAQREHSAHKTLKSYYVKS